MTVRKEKRSLKRVGLIAAGLLACVGVSLYMHSRDRDRGGVDRTIALSPVEQQTEHESITRLPNLTENSEQDVTALPREPVLRVPDKLVRNVLRGGQITNSEKTQQELLKTDSKAIVLRNAFIDTVAFNDGVGLDIPEKFKSNVDNSCYIVQFDHVVGADERAALEACGATISHYVPHAAFAVHAEPESLQKISDLASVRFIGDYAPYYKMNQDVLAYMTAVDAPVSESIVLGGKYTVMSFAGFDLAATVDRCGFEMETIQSAGNINVAYVSGSPEKLLDLISANEIAWVEPTYKAIPMNDLATETVRAQALQLSSDTLTGEGVIVAVTDTGVDYLNPAFALDPEQESEFYPDDQTSRNSRIRYYAFEPSDYNDGLAGDIDGHGTAVVGSLLGNGARSDTVVSAPGSGSAPYDTYQFAGAAPMAELVFVEDYSSYAARAQAQIAMDQGAHLSNNSWSTTNTEYSAESSLWDEIVRDADTSTAGSQELIVLFAAGNSGAGSVDGTGGTAGTIGSPANAKNVITIGAAEQLRRATNLVGEFMSGTNVVSLDSELYSDSYWQVNASSSRGPVSETDRRMKPDLVAPGSYVLTLQSSEMSTNPDAIANNSFSWDYRNGNINSGPNYTFYNGTSIATPIATGAGALIYQHYTNTYSKAPSPAMMKALMVLGAQNLEPTVYNAIPEEYQYSTVTDRDIVYQGWGMVDAFRSVYGAGIYSGVLPVLSDQANAVSTEEVSTFQVSIPGGRRGLRVVLAWSDAPGTPGNAIQLVNDLDLILRDGDGEIKYVGNFFSSYRAGSEEVVIDDEAEQNDSQLIDTYLEYDRYNNVEVLSIPELAAGTYTLEVYGYNVPEGPQSFALAYWLGSATESMPIGSTPDMVADRDGNPVMAFTAADRMGNKQIMVRRWNGIVGDESNLGEWTLMNDKWQDVAEGGVDTGVSKSFGDCLNPSIAIDNNSGDIYVAWEEHGNSNQYARVFLRWYDASQDSWKELGESATANGISDYWEHDVGTPILAVAPSGRLLVAWKRTVNLGTELQPDYIGERVFVKFWDGDSWEFYGDVGVQGIPSPQGEMVSNLSMDVDSLGRVVVVWDARFGHGFRVYRADGTNWSSLPAPPQEETALYPSVAMGLSGDFYMAYEQGTGINFDYDYMQVQIMAARYTDESGWQSIGDSLQYPYVSETPFEDGFMPTKPSMSVSINGDPAVTWLGDVSVSTNNVFAKVYKDGSWQGIDGSDSLFGIGDHGGNYTNMVSISDNIGYPVVAAVNMVPQAVDDKILVYGISDPRSTPTFGGINSAVGNDDGTVTITWNQIDDGNDYEYLIYKGASSFFCGATDITCSSLDVFSTQPILTVTGSDSVVLSGLTVGQVYCFGVRARSTAGLTDDNVVMRSAGPWAGAGDPDSDYLANSYETTANTEPCVADTDGDEMIDGWEWTFSLFNPAHVNALAMNPVDNGYDNVRSNKADDGDEIQASHEDMDDDGLTNYEEYLWWLNNGAHGNIVGGLATGVMDSPDPTNPDTDGDLIFDGWEVLHDRSPIVAESNDVDLDHDGLDDLGEFLAGTDRDNPDTDGDGLYDGVYNPADPDAISTDPEDYEGYYGSDPKLSDTDFDGLTDSYEVQNGTDPIVAKSIYPFLTDGDLNQLDITDLASASNAYVVLVGPESFETNTVWEHRSTDTGMPFDFWHISSTNPIPPRTDGVEYESSRTESHAYRMANDRTVDGTNLDATYQLSETAAVPLECALFVPAANAADVDGLEVRWNEFYETEPQRDVCFIEVSTNGVSWKPMGDYATGNSTYTDPDTEEETIGWVHRRIDISEFAGSTNVMVRFKFVADQLNNNFRGWWVDDVAILGTKSISGWVRSDSGAPLEGVTVYAMGRGGIPSVKNGLEQIQPGKIFSETLTAEDGSYTITGLAGGNYRVKTLSVNYESEFFNGELFDGVYEFGAGLNPGVVSDEDVGAGGVVSLIDTNAVGDVHFELSLGRGLGYLGVTSDEEAQVQVDGLGVQVWDGNASVDASLVPYTSKPSFADLVDNKPDWYSNPVEPALINDLAPGLHWLGIDGSADEQIVTVNLRQSETYRLEFKDELSTGWLLITAEDSGTATIWLDGVQTAFTVPHRFEDLQIGEHFVSLSNVLGNKVGVKKIVVEPGVSKNVHFSESDVAGYAGWISIESINAQGVNVRQAEVYLNGELVDDAVTPAVVENLLPGTHYVTIRKDGYIKCELLPVEVHELAETPISFVLHESDKDYDYVGDRVEIDGYDDIFAYDGEDDPDGDLLTNAKEYEIYDTFGVYSNPFDADTDGDGADDGAELAHDGDMEYMAQSTVARGADIGDTQVVVDFAGKFLDGVSYFTAGSVSGYAIDGDRFDVNEIAVIAPAVPSADTVTMTFGGIPTGNSYRSLDTSHIIGTVITADTFIDEADSDGDGIWDGFEKTYTEMPDPVDPSKTLLVLDALEAGGQDDDPDTDDLSNYREFLGPDGYANLLDSTDPTSADSDGDRMNDGWEYQYGLDPLIDDSTLDLDEDTLLNIVEYYFGSSPATEDSDEDSLPDADESWYGTDPWVIDTDGDGLLDGREMRDRDLDGVADGGFFPAWYVGADMDNDGNPDGALDWDTDGDGMPDGFEVLDSHGDMFEEPLNPSDPSDANLDPDGDGLTNLQEYLVRGGYYGNPPWLQGEGLMSNVVWQAATDPFDADTDNDGMPDGFEVEFGLHPADPVIEYQIDPVTGDIEPVTNTVYYSLAYNADIDGDGMSNRREYDVRFLLDGDDAGVSAIGMSTDPWDPDTDDDGLSDGIEDRMFRSNPLKVDTDDDGLTDGVTTNINTYSEIAGGPLVRSIFFVMPIFDPVSEADLGRQIEIAKLMAPTVIPEVEGLEPHLPYARGRDYYDLIEAVKVHYAENMRADFPMRFMLGATNETGETNAWVWGDGQAFTEVELARFSDDQDIPAYVGDVVDSNEVPNVLSMVNHERSAAAYGLEQKLFEIGGTNLYDAVVLQWDAIDRSYDEGMNDIWVLTWYEDEEYPIWQKQEVEGEKPEGRYGAVAVYNPVVEYKLPRDDLDTEDRVKLMDSRALEVMYGANGTNILDSVWRYSITDNRWYEVPQDLSEVGHSIARVGASPLTEFTYPVDIDWCEDDESSSIRNGTAVGLPRNRPWESDSNTEMRTQLFFGQEVEGSAYLFDGMTTIRSTDNMDPIIETNDASTVAAYFLEGTNATESVKSGTSGIVGYKVDGESIYPGYTGLYFPGFNVRTCSDVLVAATLKLDIDSPPVGTELYLEFSTDSGMSDADYEPGSSSDPKSRYEGGSTKILITNDLSSADYTDMDITSNLYEIINNRSWEGGAIGLLLVNPDTGAGSTTLRSGESDLIVVYQPLWKYAEALIEGVSVYPDTVDLRSDDTQDDYDSHVSTRKFAPIAQITGNDGTIGSNGIVGMVFGGINGNEVLADTWVMLSHPYATSWSVPNMNILHLKMDVNPPARWGHCMVYDASADRVLMFGGFNAKHEALNDLWAFSLSDRTWSEVTDFQDDSRPRPRGGAMAGFPGGFEYDRGLDSYSVNHGKYMVIFGGTDGERYLNDTWMYHTDYQRWIRIHPGSQSTIYSDEFSETETCPPPRAFGNMLWAQNWYELYEEEIMSDEDTEAYGGLVLFGGMRSALPTGTDTDRDGLEDGLEHALGGVEAGRDPRINASEFLSTETTEIAPYEYVNIGPVAYASVFNGIGVNLPIADFESLRSWLEDESEYADSEDAYDSRLPYEMIEDATAPTALQDDYDEVRRTSGVETPVSTRTTHWWHRYGGEQIYNVLDEWELGAPQSSVNNPNMAPDTAHSGQWCYGTDLGGFYPKDAKMALYSPLFDLPSGTVDHGYALQFYEWVDLADENDFIRIEAITPETTEDIGARVAGSKPTVILRGDMNEHDNTDGEWRKVVVSLGALDNVSNVYFRFSLTSDSSGEAGGWYIDDVAIIRGGEIIGNAVQDGSEYVGAVGLYGENSLAALSTRDTNSDGSYSFGLLPFGNYTVGVAGSLTDVLSLTEADSTVDADVDVVPITVLMAMSSGNVEISWESVPSAFYRVEYCDNFGGADTWVPMTTVQAQGTMSSYWDYSLKLLGTRIYRVVYVGVSN